jgi:arabinose-5-phosphate isomerase
MADKAFDVVAEAARVLQLEGSAILRCAERVSGTAAGAQFRKALEIFQRALDGGGKLVVTGVGKSGKVAQKIAATLASTGSFAIYLHPTEGLHGDLGVVTARDAVLALSYTGNTDELVRLVPSLRQLRVPIVGLGGNSKSRLAELCDAWVDGAIEQEACPHNLAPTTSTTLALALGDAIAVALMQLRGFDAKAFAQNHPGGSLGRRLNLTVGDVMHSGDAVGTLGAEASMDEVVGLSTRKKLGGVLVVDGTRLLGIITDGDIRRALQHREKFFGFRAADVMTREPVTATPDLMASEALALMENRPSQISVLPVVDPADRRWLGLLRLHDLVRAF